MSNVLLEWVLDTKRNMTWNHYWSQIKVNGDV